MSFYEVLDDVFDKLSKTYSTNNIDLVKHKQNLIYIYENENNWRCAEIKKLIIPKKWYIDETGQLHSAD
jgi:hypothetical protein